MLAPRATGTCAGSLEVVSEHGMLTIAGPKTISVGGFTNPASAARGLLHAVIQLLMAARPDLLWLHAGAVACAGRALILSAASGQGKSTVAGELLARGWSYLSDEIAPIDPTSCTVLPFPITPYKRVSQKQGLSNAEVLRLDKVRVDIHRDAVSTLAVPVERVYFLSYAPHARAVQLIDCSPAAAVIEALRNSLGSSTFREVELRALCELMSRVAGTHLSYASAPDVADQIGFFGRSLNSEQIGG